MYILKNKKYKYLFLVLRSIFLAIVLFSGCNLGPKYNLPCPLTPDHWKVESNAEEADDDHLDLKNWWEIFDDDLLNELEIVAVANNQTLYAAIQKVFEARALAGIRGADLFPQFTLDPGYSNIGTLIQVFGIPPPLPTIIRVHELQYSLPLNLKYELDLWGKLRSQYRSAILNVQAQEMALQTALLILTSDLASHYFQLRTFDSQLDLLARTIRVRKDALEVNQERYEKGLINFSDVTRAETELYRAEVQYSDVSRQRALKENMIAVLLSKPASDFQLPHIPLQNPPPAIPAGIPSQILLNRPDIWAVERKAASEHALIGAAYASFFPSISLTGALGFSSPDLKDFLSWKSRLWSMGVNIAQSVFDGWRNLSALDLTWARFREASADYQQQVMIAFEEVENALVSLKFEKEEIDSLQKAVTSSKETTALSEDRYFRGLVNYLDVVDSERTQLELERDLVDQLGKHHVSTVKLIKALGGRW